jgi:hypothetical protein
MNRIFSNDHRIWATQYSAGWTIYHRGVGVVACGLSESDAKRVIYIYNTNDDDGNFDAWSAFAVLDAERYDK